MIDDRRETRRKEERRGKERKGKGSREEAVSDMPHEMWEGVRVQEKATADSEG